MFLLRIQRLLTHSNASAVSCLASWSAHWVMSAGSSFADGKSELDKACWPQTWLKDVVAREARRSASGSPTRSPKTIHCASVRSTKQVTMLIAAGRWDEALPLVNAFLEKHPDATDVRLRRIELLNGTFSDAGSNARRPGVSPSARSKRSRASGPGTAAISEWLVLTPTHFNRSPLVCRLDPRNLDLLQGLGVCVWQHGTPPRRSCRSEPNTGD